MRGRKSHIETLCALATLALMTAAVMTVAVPAECGDGFLIPGVALSDAVFEVGAWCRYLVVDEVMGVSDTTIVYLAVTGTVESKGSPAWWLELESTPKGSPPEQKELAKALVSSAVKNVAPGDSLVQFVTELYLKKGSGPVEQADPSGLKQLTLSNPTPDSEWTVKHGVNIDTPNGSFVGDYKHLTVTDDREIDMGRVTLIKNDTDVFDVWLSDEVPIFRVVKCDIERVRDSRTVPEVPGIPGKEREQSRTTVELVSFGKDATSKIQIP
ncbi:MAG: hypothetical protein PVF33_03775 [Candidatus Latescibacterota bacterium]|jgi:hypothetical protein